MPSHHSSYSATPSTCPRRSRRFRPSSVESHYRRSGPSQGEAPRPRRRTHPTQRRWPPVRPQCTGNTSTRGARTPTTSAVRRPPTASSIIEGRRTRVLDSPRHPNMGARARPSHYKNPPRKSFVSCRPARSPLNSSRKLPPDMVYPLPG